MSENNRRGIKVTLDKERIFNLDFNVLCHLEKITGKNFLKTETFDNLTARDFRSLVCAAFRGNDPDLTEERAGELIAQYPAKIKDAMEHMKTGQLAGAPDPLGGQAEDVKTK